MGIVGDVELLAKLAELEHIDGDMAAALAEGGKVIAAGARQRCKSSHVRDAITEGPDKHESRPGNPVHIVSVTHERAAVEEFGTGPREGELGPHNFPARPFMRPAADEQHSGILKGVETKLGGRFR